MKKSLLYIILILIVCAWLSKNVTADEWWWDDINTDYSQDTPSSHSLKLIGVIIFIMLIIIITVIGVMAIASVTNKSKKNKRSFLSTTLPFPPSQYAFIKKSYCPKCGCMINDTNSICPFCGKKV
jgi:hypothetical protein